MPSCRRPPRHRLTGTTGQPSSSCRGDGPGRGRRHRGRRVTRAHLPPRRRLPHHASDGAVGAISGVPLPIYTYTRRYHPNESLKRPLIDYEASLLFCPALLAGTMFGSVFSVMFPPWLTVVLLVALLGYSGRRTLHKGDQNGGRARTSSRRGRRSTKRHCRTSRSTRRWATRTRRPSRA